LQFGGTSDSGPATLIDETGHSSISDLKPRTIWQRTWPYQNRFDRSQVIKLLAEVRLPDSAVLTLRTERAWYEWRGVQVAKEASWRIDNRLALTSQIHLQNDQLLENPENQENVHVINCLADRLDAMLGANL
jgi:hypothetical protein